MGRRLAIGIVAVMVAAIGGYVATLVALWCNGFPLLPVLDGRVLLGKYFLDNI